MVSGSMEIKQSNSSLNNTSDCTSQLNVCTLAWAQEIVSGGLINCKLRSHSLEAPFQKVTSVPFLSASP